jgi:cytochrome P450
LSLTDQLIGEATARDHAGAGGRGVRHENRGEDMSATAEIPPIADQVGRVSGTRVAYDTFLHGLRTDGPLVSGSDGTDIARFTFNRRTAFLLKHPDLVDHVLFGAVERYQKSIEYELLRAALGLSLFTDEGESWRRHRMMLNPVLAKRHLESLFDLMLVPVETFIEKLDGGQERIDLEMSAAMTELTLDVVGSALFGQGMADLARRIGPRVTFGLRSAERATRLILLFNPPQLLARALALGVRHAPLLPPPIGAVHEVLKVIDETVWGVIHDRQRSPGGRADDLLGLLLSVRDENGAPLPLRRVRDEACTFMLAGHETTANALSWMWYLLALNHEARERMLAEVDEVLGERRPSFEDVDRLQWTTACFLEAMRVFPPAWIIPRQCVEEDEIAGHRIPKGSSILIPIHALHHDERFWPAPEVFDPTRFLPENAHHHRCSYLPFGAGRRVCAGKAFAVIEGTIVTAMMSQRFTYELVPGYPVVPEATLTLRPRFGLPMIARRRRVASAPQEVAA